MYQVLRWKIELKRNKAREGEGSADMVTTKHDTSILTESARRTQYDVY